MTSLTKGSRATAAPAVEDLSGLARSGFWGRVSHQSMRVGRRLGLLHPFYTEDPTPPPRRPATLNGSFWAVTAYFNPSGGRVQRANYRRFRERLAEQGVPLLTVELAFADRPFDLDAVDADRLVQVRGGDVLWQKERLLNLGIEALPSDCDRVAWLDADVLFDRPDWGRETARLLESYVVVQPFLRRVRLAEGVTDADPSGLPIGMGEGQIHYGVAYGVGAKGLSALGNYRRHGSTGFAWAARRSLLSAHGLYDRLILGSSDKSMARAMFRGAAGLALEPYPPALAKHLAAWANRFYEDVGGSVGYTDCTVLHLWHGSQKRRKYAERNAGLEQHDYDPVRDITCSPGCALVWSGRNESLRTWVEAYFEGRTAPPAGAQT